MNKGATAQATYYDRDRKIVISCCDGSSKIMTVGEGSGIQLISGRDILTNSQVNVVSIMIATTAGYFYFGPYIFS